MNAAVRQPARLATHLCASCLILPAALADEYSWQVSGGYRDENASGAVQIHHRLLRVRYYLSPVDDAAGPYEVAPFLNRSSYVALGAGRTNLREEAYPSLATVDFVANNTPTVDPAGLFVFQGEAAAVSPFTSESGFDTSDYAVKGRYVWPTHGWYAGARAQRGGGNAAPLLPFYRATDESTRTGFFAGRYVGPRTAVEVDLGSESMSEDVRMNVPGFDPLFGLPSLADNRDAGFIVDFGFGLVTDVQTREAAVSVRHVGSLVGSTFEFSASVRASRSEARFSLHTPADLVDWVTAPAPTVGRFAGPIAAFAPVRSFPSESEREIRVFGALFPVDSLGVRLTVSTSVHDAYGTGDLVGLSANWFFVRNAAFEIELTRRTATRGYAPDTRATDSLDVRLLGRF